MNGKGVEGVKLDRRSAIGLVGGAGLAALATGALAQVVKPGAAGHIPTWNTGLQRLAPDLYAFIREGGDGVDNASLSNAGLIVGPDNAMIIDALGPPVHAKEFRAAVLRTTNKPVTRLVNTHHHRDHTNGDYLWQPAEIVMTPVMRELVLAQGIPAHPYDTRPDWQAGVSELKLAPPTTVITGETTYYYGDREVRLLLPGPGHTAGDIMVYLPREKILFTGDIAFFKATPATFAASIGPWLKTIDRIMAMDVDIIVPGHGPVGGKAELAEARDYLKLLVNEIRRGYNAGKRPAEAAADVDLGRFANWGNPERIPAAAVRLYLEWNGTAPLDTDTQAQAAAQAEYAAIMAARARRPGTR
jgi:glyoxylase-like metal-dependent hydrolase (beta-lactamase superfamily II)